MFNTSIQSLRSLRRICVDCTARLLVESNAALSETRETREFVLTGRKQITPSQQRSLVPSLVCASLQLGS